MINGGEPLVGRSAIADMAKGFYSAFPDLGVSYGVFAGKDPKISPWALNRGWVYLDDEDDNNKNQPKNPPMASAWPAPEYCFCTASMSCQSAICDVISVRKINVTIMSRCREFKIIDHGAASFSLDS